MQAPSGVDGSRFPPSPPGLTCSSTALRPLKGTTRYISKVVRQNQSPPCLRLD